MFGRLAQVQAQNTGGDGGGSKSAGAPAAVTEPNTLDASRHPQEAPRPKMSFGFLKKK